MKNVTDNPDFNAIPKMKYVEAPVIHSPEELPPTTKGTSRLMTGILTGLAIAGSYYLIVEWAKTNQTNRGQKKN
jgi:hypothetical protein